MSAPERVPERSSTTAHGSTMASRVHPGRVGDERAETYLRMLAEAELRRVSSGLRPSSTPRPGPMPGPGRTRRCSSPRSARSGEVGRAGRILLAAGVLDQEGRLSAATGYFFDAIQVRSRLLLDWVSQPGRAAPHHIRARCRPAAASRGRPGHAGHAYRADARSPAAEGPAALHLMSLVATGTEALITVVRRVRWPADGSSSDLEVTGAGPHHLPYDQFWAVDDQGTRYTARFEGGYGETAAWRRRRPASHPCPRAAPGGWT